MNQNASYILSSLVRLFIRIHSFCWCMAELVFVLQNLECDRFRCIDELCTAKNTMKYYDYDRFRVFNRAFCAICVAYCGDYTMRMIRRVVKATKKLTLGGLWEAIAVNECRVHFYFNDIWFFYGISNDSECTVLSELEFCSNLMTTPARLASPIKLTLWNSFRLNHHWLSWTRTRTRTHKLANTHYKTSTGIFMGNLWHFENVIAVLFLLY